MRETVHFDNGAYVPSTLEGQLKLIQADAVSIHELLSTFYRLLVSASDTNDVYEEGNDNDLHDHGDDEGYSIRVRKLSS